MDDARDDTPWSTLHDLLSANDRDAAKSLLSELEPFEIARTISRLGADDQKILLELLGPEEAAFVIEEVPGPQAAEIIEHLPANNAAAILDEVRSDHQADLLGSMSSDDAEAIIEQMTPEEADDVRKLLDYRENTVGALMMTEFLVYPEHLTVAELVSDLRDKRESYADFSVQYLYVVDVALKLIGVLPIRDLVFSRKDARVIDVMIPEPRTLAVEATLEEAQQFFDRHSFLGAPVVDASGRLAGVVTRSQVDDATEKEIADQLLHVSGIVGGEEFRTMPLLARSRRRLSWLSINIVLNIVAASVIAFYSDTLAAVIALAVFLPMISDMSGCSGNQAVAVSMRELSLGLVRPAETWRVMGKEALVGLINGLVLGALLGGVALLWKGSPYLGLVVGFALAANTLIAVCLGGTLPLILQRLKLDPALVSGPVLTTVTDMCGFFLVLGLATLLLDKLV